MLELPALTLSSLLALAPAPAPAPIPSGVAAGPDAVASPDWKRLSWEQLLARLSPVPVVAVGESHENPEHHRRQALLAEALSARGPLGVGFEMVSFDQQAALDGFTSGATSETEFAAWWKKNWGFDYSLYKPLFDVIRAKNLPAFGLNAPRELVRAVARKGLAGLTPEERARLPLSVRQSDNGRYREYVRESLSSHGPQARILFSLLPEWSAFEGGKVPEDVLARMTDAMAVWNETMGDQAAKRAREGRQILVIAGQGHVFWGAGVPESARRRGAAKTAVVLPYSPDGEIDLADYWLVGP